MSGERIYGVFEYKGEEYQYTLEDQILTVPQVPFQQMENFKENEQMDIIHGATSNYQGIVFLGCKVLAGIFPFSSEVKIRVYLKTPNPYRNCTKAQNAVE